MPATTTTLYDTDFVQWTQATAKLVRAGRFDEIDLEHLAEEVEDLGKSERSAVASQLESMLMHLVKRRIQPERAGSSWRNSITNARIEIRRRIKDSPSLLGYINEMLQDCYRDAIKRCSLPDAVSGGRASGQMSLEPR